MLLHVPMLVRASASGRMEKGLRSHSLRLTCSNTLHGEGGVNRGSHCGTAACRPNVQSTSSRKSDLHLDL